MINFTVGPVKFNDEVLELGGIQLPYFRTDEFSDKILENERLIKKFTNAEENARVVFITGSGTASMEAVISNCFTSDDKVLIVNGGTFGQRFVDICQIYKIFHTEINLDVGQSLTYAHLTAFEGKGYTGFLVNICETSTGVYYDKNLISDFCKNNDIFLVIDAISSFLADEFDMSGMGTDVMITSSQKALACPPGISIIVLSSKAILKVESSKIKSLYFNLKAALSNAERGQTPFTPAVSIILQINARLREIDNSELGVVNEYRKAASLALDFRERISDLPLDICSDSLSNSVTPFLTRNCSAYDIAMILKNEYNIWVCPNGGNLREKIFRVGHIGALTISDNEKLSIALHDLHHRGILK